MPVKTTPLTFDADLETIDRLTSFKESSGTASISIIVRKALEDYDFDSLQSPENTSRQISVRLPKPLRDEIRDVSRAKNISVGEIIRAALSAFLGAENLDRKDPLIEQPRQTDQPSYTEPDESADENPWQI